MPKVRRCGELFSWFLFCTQYWFQAEAESKMESDEIRERIFELETKLEENAEQIRKLVRGMVRWEGRLERG